MIGAPSDIREEFQIAKEVLGHWNNLHSERDKMVLLPLHWSISSYPVMGKQPQKSINEQVVEKSDLLVCIFGSKIGTPTDTEISGTVEEIKEHKKAGKDVMIFFKLSVDDITSVDPEQLLKIKEFKESVKNEVLWCQYAEAKDFHDLLLDKLQLYINDKWAVEQIEEEKIGLASIIDSFSDFDKERIIGWTMGNNMTSHSIDFIGGNSTYIVGSKQYEVHGGREKADWNDFYERLLKVDFICIDKYDKHGKPIYRLKKAAYDYVNSLR